MAKNGSKLKKSKINWAWNVHLKSFKIPLLNNQINLEISF